MSTSEAQAEAFSERDRFTPVYVRIQESIRASLMSGALKPGDRLPTEAELASEYQTTRSTVRHALDRLVYEGLIIRHVGRGSFVSEKGPLRAPIDSRRVLTFEEQMLLSGHAVAYGSATLELVKTPADVATMLGIEPDGDVFKMERLRLINGRPVGLEIRYFPVHIGRHVTGEMLAHRSTHVFVSDILGERMPTIVVSITAELVCARVAKLLQIAEGAAVSVRCGRHHASDGRAIVCGRSIFPGDISTDYVLGRELPAPKKR